MFHCFYSITGIHDMVADTGQVIPLVFHRVSVQPVNQNSVNHMSVWKMPRPTIDTNMLEPQAIRLVCLQAVVAPPVRNQVG